ncbi:MAG: phosphotransferase [Clostridia bacterium]|nr:phosphotransferase [Clostridia bacterium]
MYQIKGKIDTTNAAEFEKDLMAAKPAVIDASELEYISSAGLRVLLKLAKAVGDVTINNVSNEVYEIFEVTGFTEILNVSKRLKEINIDNAVLLGAGANGRAYRLDDERIVKVYNKISNPPEKIRREQESARRAFVHGVPSAIPFELVTVGDELGMIYELVDANTLGSVVHNAPEKLREYALRMSALMKKLHSTEMEKDTMPDARMTLRLWADIAAKSDYYSEEDMQRVYDLIDSIPVRNTFIHGDYHPGNIMVQNDELILIDMGDASVGHPVIDLLGTYHLLSLTPKKNPDVAMRYLSMTAEEAVRMWDIFIRDYLGTDDDKAVADLEESLKSYALIRSLGGIVFSDVIPEEKRRYFSALIMKDLLGSIEKADMIIKAV